MLLSSLTCRCGSVEVFAVAPGCEPEGASVDLFAPIAANGTAGTPARAYCWACWAARYAAGAPET